MFKNLTRGTKLLTTRPVTTIYGVIPAGSEVLFNTVRFDRVSVYYQFVKGLENSVEVSPSVLTVSTAK